MQAALFSVIWQSKHLISYAKELKLSAAKGDAVSEYEECINGVTFAMNDNPMGIHTVRLEFNQMGGTLFYTNAQGDKELRFGRCENVLGDFPEEGYSDVF